jgi:hypothetical protein
MKRTSVVLGVLLLLVAGWAGGAHAVTLNELLNGGSITAGDKLFDQWDLYFYGASDPDRVFNPDNILVEALTDGGMDPGPGLRFQVVSGELTVVGDNTYAFVDLKFGFRVSALGAGLLIKDNTLAFGDIGGAFWSIALDGSYDVGSYIKETVGTGPGLADLGEKDVEFSVLEAGQGQQSFSKLTDSASFDPRREIWVTKNILVWAADDTDSAGIFGFEQRFSQTVVPEPGTFLLLGTGLAGLAAWRRRRG